MNNKDDLVRHYLWLRRYGLNDHDVATLDELARELSVTRERVRQIQGEALEKLRARLKQHGVDKDALL